MDVQDKNSSRVDIKEHGGFMCRESANPPFVAHITRSKNDEDN